MKRNIFSKFMAILVVVSCAFIFAACGDLQKPGANITSFVIDTTSIPEVIVVGEFDKAGIKATVNYSDGTDEEITITTAMIPEEYRDLLNTPGIYDIELMFRNQKAELQVRMVNSTNIYQVNFYNHKNQIISTQFVYDGEDATLPTDFMASVENYAFVAWDRSHEDISEDTNIYGLYVNVENTLSDAKMMEVLLNAEQYYITHDHFTTMHENESYSGQTYNSKSNINYHYDSENGVATSQRVTISSNSLDDQTYKFISICGEDAYEALSIDTYDGEYDYATYEELRESFQSEGVTDEEFEQMMIEGKLYGGENITFGFNNLLNGNNDPNRLVTVDFSYEITSNKLIYTCTVTYTDSNDSPTEIDSYTIKYDNEKILQIICNYSYENGTYNNSSNTTINIDYATFEFEELITDDLRVLCDLDVAMHNMLKNDFVLSATIGDDTDTVKYDADNKIVKVSNGDSVDDNYMYISDNYQYEGDINGLDKTQPYNFDADVLDYFNYRFSRIINGYLEGNITITTNEREDTIVTLDEQDYNFIASWRFNNESGLLHLVVDGLDIEIGKINVELEVPEDIKALEKDAQEY